MSDAAETADVEAERFTVPEIQGAAARLFPASPNHMGGRLLDFLRAGREEQRTAGAAAEPTDSELRELGLLLHALLTDEDEYATWDERAIRIDGRVPLTAAQHQMLTARYRQWTFWRRTEPIPVPAPASRR